MKKRPKLPRNTSPEYRKLESISSSFDGQVKDDPSFLEGQPIVATGLLFFLSFASGQRNALLQVFEKAQSNLENQVPLDLSKEAHQTSTRRLSYD